MRRLPHTYIHKPPQQGSSHLPPPTAHNRAEARKEVNGQSMLGTNYIACCGKRGRNKIGTRHHSNDARKAAECTQDGFFKPRIPRRELLQANWNCSSFVALCSTSTKESRGKNSCSRRKTFCLGLLLIAVASPFWHQARLHSAL